MEAPGTSYMKTSLVGRPSILLQYKLTPNFKVYKHMVIAVVVRQIMENAKALCKKLRVIGVSRVDIQDSTSSWYLWEGLHSDAHNDSKRARTATLKGPEEVGIFLGVGGNVFALSSDGFEGKYVVGTHTIEACKRTMPAALNVPTSPSNSLRKISRD